MKLLSKFFGTTFLALFFFASGYGQDTVYYQYPRLRVPSLKSCDYYSLITKDAVNNHTQEVQYNKQGKKLEEEHYFYLGREKINIGIWKTWYPNGQLKSEIAYGDDGKMNGELKTFWQDGSPKRVDTFSNDSLVSGVCFSQSGQKIPHFDYHISPHFPGGVEKLYDFLRKNIFYPQTYQPLSGKVIARFLVNEKGEIEDIQIMNETGEFMSKQVIHAIKKMPDWIPGELDGEPDSEYVLLPVSFTRN